MAHKHGIKGQSEAAQNARLDRGCCPIHGIGMSQIAGWWYPLDEPPFTLVSCDRKDCDVTCKSVGPDGPLSAPLTRDEIRALPDHYSVWWEIEDSAHSLRSLMLAEAQRLRDAGEMSMQDYATIEHNAQLVTNTARTFLAMLDASQAKRVRPRRS